MPRQPKKRHVAVLAQVHPPIREQAPPYHRSMFRFGYPEVHMIGAYDGVELEYGIDKRHTWGKSTNLARLEVKTSNIPDAGYGTFAYQDITKNQLLTEYYGIQISEKDAYYLKLKVLLLVHVATCLHWL